MAKPREVCAGCGLELEIARVGVEVLLMAGNPPFPYELWGGDMLRCYTCDAHVITRFAQKGAAHFEEDFREKVEKAFRAGRIVLCWETPRMKPVNPMEYIRAWITATKEETDGR